MDLEEKVIASKDIYQGSILDLQKQTVKLVNGEIAYREVVHHAKAVAMLVLTDNNKIILEKQWRAPVKQPMIEIPAGKMDDRDEGNPEKTLIRELNEELRLKSDDFELIHSIYPSVGFSDEFMYIYLVKNLKSVENDLDRDQGEFLEINEYSMYEAEKMIQNGEISDAKTIIAIQFWKLMQSR